MIDRRTALAAALALPAALRAAPAEPGGGRILRIPAVAAETGFDPARVSDLYSATVTAHIFEALYAYDPLAWPVKPRPLTAAAMPEVSDDYRV